MGMTKKKSVWTKIAMLALAVAPIVATGGASMFFWGEPKLPAHLDK